MNERIKDFAKRAKEHAEALFPDHTKFNHSQNWHEAYHEKFAELIVRECMEQVWYTREDGINGNVSEVIKDRMKQHFGVQE